MDLYLYAVILCLHLGMLLHLTAVSGNSVRNSYHSKASSHLTGYDIPVLKMLRRQIRHFRQGARASVTLVFRATQPTMVRWLRKDETSRMSGAEEKNMVPVEGDPKYEISMMRSGDVIATTLMIPGFKEHWSQSFLTMLTLEDASMQYNIFTKIDRVTNHSLENIDSPEWMLIPPPKRHFRPNRPLSIGCRIFVPHEKESQLYSNELKMYRVIPPSADAEPRMEYHTQVVIHRDTNWQKGEEDHILGAILQGRRQPLPRGHVIYEVRLDTMNATLAFAGVYQCGLEREFDRVYVTSQVMPYAHEPLSPSRVTWTPCDPKEVKSSDMLELVEDKLTCVRCRGFGYPYAEVGLFDSNDQEIQDSDDISVSKYINVADAGVSEATYTFRRPHRGMAGQVFCRAVRSNSKKSYRDGFRLHFVPSASRKYAR